MKTTLPALSSNPRHLICLDTTQSWPNLSDSGWLTATGSHNSVILMLSVAGNTLTRSCWAELFSNVS
eukprot:4637599-Pyramimonas_sp.AAC.1